MRIPSGKTLLTILRKDFGFLLLLVIVFGPVLLLMITSGVSWFAYLFLSVSTGTLMVLRRKNIGQGWMACPFWLLAVAGSWVGLFSGQPVIDIQQDTAMNTEQAVAPYRLLINNTTIVDTYTGNLLHNMSILCSEGKIQEIATTGTIHPQSGTKIVDATGKYAVPGYLDMHMHIIGRTHIMEAMDSMLAYGVTGFRQMDGSFALLKDWNTGVFSSSSVQPQLLTMPGDVLTPINAPVPDVAVDFIRMQKKAGARFIKVGGLRPEVFNAVQEEANIIGIPVEGHVLPDMSLRDVAANGFHSVEHFGINNGALIDCSTDEKALRKELVSIPKITGNPVFVQLMNIKSLKDFLNAQIIKIAIKTSGGANNESQLRHIIDTYSDEKALNLADTFVKYNTWQCPTMVRVRKGLFENSSESMARELYHLYLKLVKIYDSKGVKMMTGTDAGAGEAWRIAGPSLHEEFDELERARIPPLHVLQMATLNGSEFLGRLDDLGSVAVGKYADIVLLDKNPIESIQNLHTINAVIRAGFFLDKQQDKL